MANNTAQPNDDYSLVRVPQSERRSWLSVGVQRFGQVSSFQQFMVGAALGYGMTFWNAFLAITLGSAMLQVITILLGIAGVREGLSTSVLSRWAGFGRKGSALVGLLVAVSLAGWFGVQNGVFARGMYELTGWSAEWVWAVLGGVVVTIITLYGFKSMQWAANIMVPTFLLLAGWSIWDVLQGHSIGELMSSPPPGEPMSLATGTTLVAGAFIVAAIMTPDMTRFNRTPGDVVKQTVVSVTLGEYVIGMIGVLLAHAAAKSDVTSIIVSSSGLLGTLILATAIMKINDWNLYSSSLGLVNSIDVLFGKKARRVAVTIVLGVIGTAVSAMGIYDHFTGFLTMIGVLAPPVAGVIIAEYFVVKTCRPVFDAARATDTMPVTSRDWVPLALVSWVAGTGVGQFLTIGIPTVNSVVVAFAIYAVVGLFLRNRQSEREAEPDRSMSKTTT